MMKIFLFGGPAALVMVVVLLLLYYGGFSPIRFEKVPAGGETVVYQEGRGDYRKSGELMDSIYERLIEAASIKTYRGFGIFYDNPKSIPTDRLSYDAGCILDESPEGAVEKLGTDFQVKTIEPREAVVTEFPFRGKLSVILGIMRVYPALNRYITENKFPDSGPIMEIYDVPAQKIVYRKFLE